jgi:hypothetical protein
MLRGEAKSLSAEAAYSSENRVALASEGRRTILKMGLAALDCAASVDSTRLSFNHVAD